VRRIAWFDDPFCVVVPTLVAVWFLAAVSGQHFADLVLFSSTTLFLLIGIVIWIVVAAVGSVLTGWGLTAALGLLSMVAACAALFVFARDVRMPSPVDDEIALMLVFWMASEFYAGLALTIRSRRYAWLALCVFAVAQSAATFLLVLSRAMGHWH
jgi:hypothetical protein